MMKPPPPISVETYARLKERDLYPKLIACPITGVRMLVFDEKEEARHQKFNAVLAVVWAIMFSGALIYGAIVFGELLTAWPH